MSEYREPYDPNGWDVDAMSGVVHTSAKLPTFKSSLMGSTIFDEDSFFRHADALSKAVEAVPSAQSYGTISYMPTISGKNIVEWPGIDPRSLKKVCDENFAPKMIVQMRVNDVVRYSRISAQPWKPGWRLEMIDGSAHMTESQRREMRKAEAFLLNCNIETGMTQTVERDEMHLSSFDTYLRMLVRDSMRFDGMATWTQRDNAGRVVAFAALPSYLIRLCTREGFNGDPSKFAVLIDDTNNPRESFTRGELNWSVRNPRTDPEVAGYGYPEAGQSIKMIGAFENALNFNSDTFDKSTLPQGILLLKGDYWTQRQVDLLTRAWNNMKKGISKAWTFPAINVPKDGNMEIMSLKDLKGTDIFYKDHMNLVAGVFCATWNFPPQRLGYHPSGGTTDSAPPPDQSTAMIGDDDPGLSPLLISLENHINPILWSRWPEFRFTFCGKNPKEDAREYEARSQAQTQDERRAMADLPPTESLYPKEFKLLGKLMGLCPTDSNQTGAFTTLASIVLKAALGVDDSGNADDEKDRGAKTGEKRDPAKSEAHGAVSGVRRDSASEKGKS
jgi:hypothetical protein